MVEKSVVFPVGNMESAFGRRRRSEKERRGLRKHVFIDTTQGVHLSGRSNGVYYIASRPL